MPPSTPPHTNHWPSDDSSNNAAPSSSRQVRLSLNNQFSVLDVDSDSDKETNTSFTPRRGSNRYQLSGFDVEEDVLDDEAIDDADSDYDDLVYNGGVPLGSSRPQRESSILDPENYAQFGENASPNASIDEFSDQDSIDVTDSIDQLTKSQREGNGASIHARNRSRHSFHNSINLRRSLQRSSVTSNKFPMTGFSDSVQPKRKFVSIDDPTIMQNNRASKSGESINIDDLNLSEVEIEDGSIPNFKDKLRHRGKQIKSAIPRMSSVSNRTRKMFFNDEIPTKEISPNVSEESWSNQLRYSQTGGTLDETVEINDNTNSSTENSKHKYLPQTLQDLINWIRDKITWFLMTMHLDNLDDEDAESTPIFGDSRYPEVRASVPNTDNFDLPQNTLRMWVLGMFMTTVGCAVNTIFSLHSPLFVISTFVASMVAWPLGRLWERFVPNVSVLGIPLNPSPFNLKEHALITIMAGVTFGEGASYMTDIVLTLKHYYNIDYGWTFNMIGIICTQAIGYSMAGIMRRILIYPASMIWPSTLVTTTFLTNIHLNVNHVTNGWHISRLRLFCFVMIGCFAWSWIPNFFAPFLSYFGFLSWMAPSNVVINQLFGARNGLGMLPITFDWNQVSSYMGSPLIPPFFAIGNILASIVVIFWIVTPIIHYSNVWYGHFLPISSVNTYDRFQQVYNVSQILTNTKVFDLEKYESYSPIFLPSTFAVSYGMSFASISSTIVHTVLFHGKEIMFYWKHSRKDPDDIHMHLMKRYKEAPDWWYLLSMMLFLGMAIALVRVWNTEMPIWALFMALALATFMVVPIGMIYALTYISVGLNVICEFIVGYLVPGRPVAMMLFKTFGYITNYQTVMFLEGMKLGHYMKISPRLLFLAQLVATIWGGVVQIAALYWAEKNIVNICSPDQGASFTCSPAQVFFNASVIWGVIGPQRQLSLGQLYNKTLYFFLVGGLLPLLTWLFIKKYPKSPIRHLHWPIFFNGTGLIPPATPYTYGAYCAVGYFFGFFIKRRYFGWWAKYNYTVSAGLDLGLAWATLLIFVITLSPSIQAPNWWGTNVINNNADNLNTPLTQLPAGEAFGPTTW